MTFRDNDDDTSAGKMTQGGSAPRRGNAIFLALAGAVIVLAIVIGVTTLPKKHSKAEEGAAPVSTSLNPAGPSGPAGAAAAPTAPAPTSSSAPR